MKKISKFIAELEKFKEENGDLFIICHDYEVGEYDPFIHLDNGEFSFKSNNKKFCGIGWNFNLEEK